MSDKQFKFYSAICWNCGGYHTFDGESRLCLSCDKPPKNLPPIKKNNASRQVKHPHSKKYNQMRDISRRYYWKKRAERELQSSGRTNNE